MQTKFDKIKKMHVCLKKIKYKRKKKYFFVKASENSIEISLVVRA